MYLDNFFVHVMWTKKLSAKALAFLEKSKSKLRISMRRYRPILREISISESQVAALYARSKISKLANGYARSFARIPPRDLTKDGLDLDYTPKEQPGYRKYRTVDLPTRSKARELTDLSFSRRLPRPPPRRLSPNLWLAAAFLIFVSRSWNWRFTIQYVRSNLHCDFSLLTKLFVVRALPISDFSFINIRRLNYLWLHFKSIYFFCETLIKV